MIPISITTVTITFLTLCSVLYLFLLYLKDKEISDFLAGLLYVVVVTLLISYGGYLISYMSSESPTTLISFNLTSW
jgi:hypothetical protein